MVNQELVKLLQEMAELKEVLGENRFKVVAYQRAAENLNYASEDLADIYRQKGLKGLDEIDGVGEAIAGHIEEYLKTGQVKEWYNLRKKVGPAVLELMDIPGVGPKTAKKLVDILHIKDIDELQSFLEKSINSKLQPKIQKLESIGLKEKSLENILQGIKVLEGREGRLPLAMASPIVEQITEYMKKAPGLDRFDVVGSYRRQKETVGDIDFIGAIAEKSRPKTEQIIAYFVNAPYVDKVINQGDTKARVIHKTGQQIDLEILATEKYGSLLQHFTGSKEHNVALRTWAAEHGFSISEHGIKIGQKSKIQSSRPAGKSQNDKVKIKKCPDEKCVYNTLGMQWIPPELRENRGEIEAAIKHELPKLIELKDIKGDLQVHTNWSDGHNTAYEMAKAAQDIGYQYIALTDHSVGLGVAYGLDQKRFADRHKEIVAVQKKLKIKILVGVEVNIRANGQLDLPDEVLKKFDYVLAAVHSSFNQGNEAMTRRLIGAIEHPCVQAIAHPSGRLIGRRPAYEVDWPVVFKAVVKHRKLLEINGLPNRLDLPDNYVLEAKKYGVKLVIGTDSHKIEHLPLMKFGISVARRGWLTKTDVLNTMEVEDLFKWLAR